MIIKSNFSVHAMKYSLSTTLLGLLLLSPVGAMDIEEEEDFTPAPPQKPDPRLQEATTPKPAAEIPADWRALTDRLLTMDLEATEELIASYKEHPEWPRSLVVRSLMIAAANGHAKAQAEMVLLHLKEQPAIADFWFNKILETEDLATLQSLHTSLKGTSYAYRIADKIRGLNNSSWQNSPIVRSINSLGMNYANLPSVGDEVRAVEAWPKKPVPSPKSTDNSGAAPTTGGAAGSSNSSSSAADEAQTSITPPKVLNDCWIRLEMSSTGTDTPAEQYWFYVREGTTWMMHGSPMDDNGSIVWHKSINSESIGERENGSSSEALLTYTDDLERSYYKGTISYNTSSDGTQLYMEIETHRGMVLCHNVTYDQDNEIYEYTNAPAVINLTNQNGSTLSGTIDGVWGSPAMLMQEPDRAAKISIYFNK